jgi:hypothetical protein
MKEKLIKLRRGLLKTPIIDILILPAVVASALVLRFVRRIGVHKFPISKRAMLSVGLMPIRDHYYEPLFQKKHLLKPLSAERNLPGIDWNISAQLALLDTFQYEQELEILKDGYSDELTFHFQNGAFGAGDAEFWYQIIRTKKPARIIEIGSGNSTKLARAAILQNQLDDPTYNCEHTCIEPYEMPWLEKLGIGIIRQKVEEVDPILFDQLGHNDILFIDSSHIIRPQGDVLYEYLELLPSLKPGVIVHVHDIFSPRDYPEEWVLDEIRFWNEQYLLEAFLTSNLSWKILAGVNYLHHNHFEKLSQKCPKLKVDHEPGSFYMQKLG